MFNEVLGSEVSVPDAPKRIISFSPAVTETLFQVGIGDSVVGVSAFCARPAEAKAKRHLGSYNTVREEVLDALNPDLILTVTGYQREFAVRLSKKYTVYPLELPVSVAGIADLAAKVGMVVGAPEKGREMERALIKRLGDFETGKNLRGYVEIDLGGPVTFGSYSYITDAFKMLGSSHIYEDGKSEWLKPDPDEVAASDPDVIIYEPKMFRSFEENDMRDLVSRRGWEGLRAVRMGNFFVTPGPLDFLAHHGPSFITEAMPWLEGRFRLARKRIEP